MTTDDGNPYSPPKAEVQDAPRERLVAERPQQIVRTTALLWLVLVLSLISTGLTIRRSPPPVPDIAGTFAFGLAVSLVRIVGIWQGRNWARIVSVVITALSVIALPNGFARQPVVSNLLDALTIPLELAVLFLVFTKPGALWFKFSRAQRVAR